MLVLTKWLDSWTPKTQRAVQTERIFHRVGEERTHLFVAHAVIERHGSTIRYASGSPRSTYAAAAESLDYALASEAGALLAAQRKDIDNGD